MRLNEFEKYIVDKVDEYPSKLDTESLWADLESNLEKKKRRKFVIIFFTLLLILIIGGFLVYEFQTVENKPVSSRVSTVENIESSVREIAPLTENTRKKENEETISNEDFKLNTTAEQFQSQKTRQVVRATNELNKSTAGQTGFPIDNAAALNSRTNATNSNLGSIEENDSAEIVNFEDIERVAFPGLPKIDFSKNEHHLGTGEDLLKIEPVTNWGLYVSSTVGVYYTDQRISQIDENGAILKGLRGSSETTLETLSLGVGIELKNKNNFFLAGGVNFNQLTERFNNQSSEFTTEDIEIVTEINYYGNGEREEIMGIYEQSQEIITTTTVYNTLRWAEFNVGGGYYYTKKRCDIGVSGGLLWGTILNAEGKILDAENNIIEIENQNPAIYKNDLGLGAFANVEVRYTLRPRLRLSTQIGYKYMSGSFTEEAYPLEIKYRWWGAAVGLHYKIH